MRLGEHVFEISEQDRAVEAVSRARLGEQLPVGFHHPDDLNLRTVPRLPEKSVDMSMHESNNADPKRGMRGCWRGLTEQNANRE
jgi:hypothetical protein